MPEPLSVLVVDDDPSISSLLRTLIVTAGGVVWSTFASGEEALDALSDAGVSAASATGRLPDVAVLDVNLPGIDGIELGRRFHELWPAIRVVLVSSMARDDLPSDAVAEATEFVPKSELGPERIRRLLQLDRRRGGSTDDRGVGDRECGQQALAGAGGDPGGVDHRT